MPSPEIVEWRGLVFTESVPETDHWRARMRGETWSVEPSRDPAVYLATAELVYGMFQGRGGDHVEALEDARRAAIERYRVALADLEGMP